MSFSEPPVGTPGKTPLTSRPLANQAFSRATGAELIHGNSICLLKDARENYPAWLEAIRFAEHFIHFENYSIYDDQTGQMFAEALLAKAREGVKVRLIYDWLGCLGVTTSKFWNRLRADGIEVRCYNPAKWDSPLGWLSRDHRKTLCVDGQTGFISGLCIARMWEGEPTKKIEPWRDTGVKICGPAVAELEEAFATLWAIIGDPLPESERHLSSPIPDQGTTSLRVVPSLPSTGAMFRVDQLIATLAHQRLWLTDAYFGGMSAYVQALRSAAQAGVDVRLLVPSATDLPLLKPLSRAGYRALLEGGVRVFEWNGTMLHAKTAVADGHWARVGSSNLNIASWFGNCEMDVIIEDEPFARSMEEMFLEDLEGATEIVLNVKEKVSPLSKPPRKRRSLRRGTGSSDRAATGVVRIANTVGAVFTRRRVIEPFESRTPLAAGSGLLLLAILTALYPRSIAYPIALLLLWISVALIYQGIYLRRINRKRKL